MTTVARVLETIKGNARGEAALLVTIDGKILAATAGTDAAMTAIASYAANYVSVSERMGEDMQRGITHALILIYRGKAIVLSPLGRSAVALVVGSRDAHLGNLRYQLRKGIPDLLQAAQTEMPELELENRTPLTERPAAPPSPPLPREAGPQPRRPAMTPRPAPTAPTGDKTNGSKDETIVPAERMKGVEGTPKVVEENGAGTPPSKPVAPSEIHRGRGNTIPFPTKVSGTPPVESPPPPTVQPSAPVQDEPVIPPAAEEHPSPPPPASPVPTPQPVQAAAPSVPTDVAAPQANAETPQGQSESDEVDATAPDKEVAEFLSGLKALIDEKQVHPGAFSIAALALEGFGEITPPLPRATRLAVIQVCGQRLRKVLRGSDLSVQFRDGTFGLLLSGVRSNQARAVVQRVTAQVLEGNLDRPASETTFRLRAGIATYPESGASAERLVRRATAALFISQIEGAIGAARKPAAEFSVAILSLEGNEKSPAMAQGFARFLQRLEATLRANDLATQLDDRKVGVLLTGVTQLQAGAIMQRIRDQMLKDNLGIPTNTVQFRLRAGVATYPNVGPLADGLLYHAESSLTFLGS